MKKHSAFSTIACVLAVLLMSMLLGACRHSSSIPLSAGTVNLMKQTEEKKPEAVKPDTAFRQKVLDFSAQLFGKSLQNGQNVMVSPSSVLNALAMTAAGAEGNTLQEFCTLFGYTDLADFHAMLSSWLDALPSDENVKLSVANSIWFRDKDFTVQQDFLDFNASAYHAGLFASPFDDSTVKDINNWVKNKTDGMIPTLLNQLDSSDYMVLVNAISFDAKWKNPYESAQVSDSVFTAQSGETGQVSMMYSDESVYLSGDGVTGFSKPYENGYSFVALLPDEGSSVQKLAEQLDGTFLQKLLDSRTYAAVSAGIPKFTSDFDTLLNDPLAEMGLTDAFTDFADFSGISDTPLCISQVIHKTHIEVDERGTKAAAVTGIVMEATSAMPDKSYRVILDRPFIYLIVEDTTGLPIFMGEVSELSAFTD